MGRVTRRIGAAALLLGCLYVTRRFYRNWGATKAEARSMRAGDTLVRDPVMQTTEAVDVDGPPSAVWQRLLLTVLAPAGVSSRETVKSLVGLAGTAAVSDFSPGPPAVGDVVHLAPRGWLGLPDGVTARVVEVVSESRLVLRPDWSDQYLDGVLSLHLESHWDGKVRLLARVRIALRHPGEVFMLELARPIIALGTRGLLLGIKNRVERPGSMDRCRKVQRP